MNPTEPVRDDIVYGREPTYEERELVTWAEETVRKGVATTQEALRQMVTLTTALLAGSTALLGQLPTPLYFKVMAALSLLFSLGASLWGSLPREALVDIRCPEEIKAARDRMGLFKMNCLRVASVSLVTAFVVILLGVLANQR